MIERFLFHTPSGIRNRLMLHRCSRQLIENAEAIGIVRTDIRCVHGQRELVAGKQREFKKSTHRSDTGSAVLPVFRAAARI